MFDRRMVLTSGAALLSSTALMGRAHSAELFPVVETSNGKVRGIVAGGIASFKGIYYAADAGGKNRFMPPQPAKKWSGVEDHLSFAPIAPQIPGNPRHVYAALIYNDIQGGGMGEDCLSLNVWTPEPTRAQKRPVIVRFHGGGFYGGSSNTPGADGAALSRFGDVVVVTVNHRLSSLGYMYLGEDEAVADSGSVGIQDLVAALGWINENIEAFGGDPSRVLIFGQSGGGAKVSHVLGMPSAKGLFQRAGVMSGSRLTAMTREAAVEPAEKLMKQLGIKPGELRKLQAVPYAEMLKAQAQVEAVERAAGEAPRSFAPVMGEAIPHHPFEPGAPDESADIPMIVSTTLDERTYRLRDFDLSFEALEKQLAAEMGEKASDVLTAYREEDPSANAFILKARINTDQTFRLGAHRMAERKAAQAGAPVWTYLWTRPSPAFEGRYGATHGVDVAPSMHDTRFPIYGPTPENARLADALAGAWVALARDGNPNHNGLPEWAAYDSEARSTMIFDLPMRVENDPRSRFRTMWAG